jgi:hypothetical protein
MIRISANGRMVGGAKEWPESKEKVMIRTCNKNATTPLISSEDWATLWFHVQE